MLKIDPNRLHLAQQHPTNIHVQVDGQPVDLIVLDKASLLLWLHHGGECNQLAENVLGMFMGHGKLHQA